MHNQSTGINISHQSTTHHCKPLTSPTYVTPEMFILTTISDLVQIPPHEFHRADLEEITDKINEKYSNKVIQNIGLCIALYDLLSASDGLISYGTGNVNVNGKLGLVLV
jgi:DNA-directed RNA polymerase III subunit RPC8